MVQVPAAVAAIFTPAVLAKIAKVERGPAPLNGGYIRNRHKLLSDEPVGLGDELYRAAWWAYIEHAERCKFFDDDLRRRLASPDDDQFRGALAECMCHWYFATVLRRTMRRNPDPNGGADFVEESGVHVEVKAPYVPLMNKVWGGDDAKVLKNNVMKAGKQLHEGVANVVVLAPILRMAVHDHRDQLVKALIGEHVWRYTISVDPDDPPQEVEDHFRQNGKLARWVEGSTDLTRVSAVATIEPVVWFRDELRIDYEVRVVHNPFASLPLPREFFGEHPQLVPVDDEGMMWTDAPRGHARRRYGATDAAGDARDTGGCID